MAYFWFSFSENGKNRGCINTEAETLEGATKKVTGLNIVPQHDDVETYEISKPEIPVDILVSPEEMNRMKYQSVKYTKFHSPSILPPTN